MIAAPKLTRNQSLVFDALKAAESRPWLTSPTHFARALQRRPAPLRRLDDHLLEQLDALETSALAVRDAAAHSDVDALMTQGSFLRTKFARSDLDL